MLHLYLSSFMLPCHKCFYCEVVFLFFPFSSWVSLFIFSLLLLIAPPFSLLSILLSSSIHYLKITINHLQCTKDMILLRLLKVKHQGTSLVVQKLSLQASNGKIEYYLHTQIYSHTCIHIHIIHRQVISYY